MFCSLNYKGGCWSAQSLQRTLSKATNTYHRVQTASQSEQQQQLEKDILDINKFIGICDSRKTPLVQLDAASQVGSLKKRNLSQKKRVCVKSYEYKHM